MTEEFESKFKKKVSLQNQFENSIWYKVDCACGCDDNCNIELEYDPDINMIFLNFYKDVSYNWWDEKEGFFNWFKNISIRFKKSMKLLFTGNLEMNENFILQDIDQINNFIEALQEGVEYCKEEKKKQEENIKNIK